MNSASAAVFDNTQLNPASDIRKEAALRLAGNKSTAIFNAYVEPPSYTSRSDAGMYPVAPASVGVFQIPNAHLLRDEVDSRALSANDQHANELKDSLVNVLEALGFENSLKIAERLVQQYDMKSLKRSVATLLRTAMPYEFSCHKTRTSEVPSRYLWFGQRVVERVVDALPHRQTTSSMQQ